MTFSTLSAGLLWIIAIFKLFSVINLVKIEKTLIKASDIDSNCKNGIQNSLLKIREATQTRFYWTSGSGVILYFLPRLIGLQ